MWIRTPMSNDKILITSALPYANGPLHFGHIAGAYLPGDCYARFERLKKNDVLFLCGSDEYGIAIALSAEIAGRTPEEHVKIYHEVIQQLFRQLNISFDHYSRTTWKGHQPVVQKYFTELLANGFIEARVTDQLYSAQDGKFLADRYVVGTCPRCGFKESRGDECTSCGASFDAIDLKDPKSKLTGAPLEKRATEHWFLLLEKFKDKLLDWIKTKDWKPNVANFAKQYIDDLHARAITRDSTWGIPVPLPNTEGKVLYVWFDAPIGYISACKDWAEKTGEPEKWKSYWNDSKTKLVHFIGKDNIPFHAVIFPAMTMGQNEPFKLVDDLPANEFYNLEGRQFSKSEGWYIDLEQFFKSYTPDQIRYTIAANAPETSDSEFTWKDFQLRCNTDLLGKLGNLVNRVLVFAKTHCNSKVPALDCLQPIDSEFLDQIRKIAKEAEDGYQHYRLRKASQSLMELAAAGNVYFDAKKPWKDAKEPTLRRSLETTIACSLECIKVLSLIAFPIIPETALKIWKQLGFIDPKNSLEVLGWDKILLSQIPEGQQLGEPEILFKKIEDVEIEAEIAKLKKHAKVPKKENDSKPLITYEEFDKLDLRVATVLKVDPVPKSKKLFCLQVDLGSEQRQIVSGIAEHFSSEQLVGRSVIVVANLKPAKIMGIESQGMILASQDAMSLKLAMIENGVSGSVVK